MFGDRSTAKCPCNQCHRTTLHDLYEFQRREENVGEVKRIGITYTAQCRGCQDISLMTDLRNVPEDVEPEVSFIPPRIWFWMPEWVKEIETLDANLYGLLREVYSAANENQYRLLAMGVRAALDHTMVLIVTDVGGFEQKLDEMVKKGFLSQKQKTMLETVIDAGSAAAHRGYKPPQPLLAQMITVMETIIRDHYITGPMLETTKRVIPPRPPRTKKTATV